jgi:hypothetical protein
MTLEEAVESDKLVVFVGAGLSTGIGMPNWNGLVKAIIDQIQLSDARVKDLSPLLDSGLLSPLQVLDKIEAHRNKILEVLVSKIQVDDDADLSTHRLLAQLCPRIITTNYDKALEKAKGDAQVVHYGSAFNISRLHDMPSYVFKIHGCVDYPDDCLIFTTQYQSRYSSLKASTLELVKIFTEKVVLFVGYSMTDPYINETLEFIRGLYDGHIPKPFIITTDKNFNHTQATPIVIDNYHEGLPAKLSELLKFKKTNLPPQSKRDERISVQILYPKPFDKPIAILNPEKLVDCLSLFDLDIAVDILNLDSLRSSDEMDLLIIITQTNKGLIIIEDEYLKGKPVELSEIQENLPPSCKAVFIFHAGPLDLPKMTFDIPFAFLDTTLRKENDVFSTFAHKVFRKGEPKLLANDYIIKNESVLPATKSKKGSASVKHYNPPISAYIDKKNVLKFIGRRTDLEFLIRKLIELKYESKILAIKGSGGIGKTTIVTKAAIELAERKHFPRGIDFVPCHAITSFENLAFTLSQTFGITNSKDIVNQIKLQETTRSRLLILDNFETLLYLPEKKEIIDLLSNIANFACVVVTTRQLLALDYEDVFELRNFTSDEAFELFRSIYPGVNPKDEKLLRQEIIENLLNNNPLAIKLIAKGLPPSKSMKALKDELEENIFREENIQEIFERPEDLNIERSNSLYHSINYSYQLLNTEEKLTFEILSLFPDGIPLESFKAFIKASRNLKTKIGDKEIKALDDKSLLENSNKFLKLQSIISRFSEFQFKNRELGLKKTLYTTALGYNHFLVRLLMDRKRFKITSSIKLLDSNTNNYLKSLQFLDSCDVQLVDKLDFIDDISFIFRSTNQPHQFRKLLNAYKKRLDSSESKAHTFLDLTDIRTRYWNLEFESSFSELQQLFPVGQLLSIDFDDKLESMMFHQAEPIYDCEGHTFEIFKKFLSHEHKDFFLQGTLFQLGFLREAYTLAMIDPDPTFFEFEALYAFGKLNIVDAQGYLSKTYKKENLEIIQMTYLLAKAGVTIKDELGNLVVSNPYSKGLVQLISALSISDKDKKIESFESSLKDMMHIKYYYLEGILLFAKFLKSVGEISRARKLVVEGLDHSTKHKFRYLQFCFESVFEPQQIYNQDNYPIDIDLVAVDQYMKQRKSWYASIRQR